MCLQKVQCDSYKGSWKDKNKSFSSLFELYSLFLFLSNFVSGLRDLLKDHFPSFRG